MHFSKKIVIEYSEQKLFVSWSCYPTFN